MTSRPRQLALFINPVKILIPCSGQPLLGFYNLKEPLLRGDSSNSSGRGGRLPGMKQGRRNSKQNSRSLTTTNFSCAQIWIFNVDADAAATGFFVSVRLWCYQEALDSGEVAWGRGMGKADEAKTSISKTSHAKTAGKTEVKFFFFLRCYRLGSP